MKRVVLAVLLVAVLLWAAFQSRKASQEALTRSQQALMHSHDAVARSQRALNQSQQALTRSQSALAQSQQALAQSQKASARLAYFESYVAALEQTRHLRNNGGKAAAYWIIARSQASAGDIAAACRTLDNANDVAVGAMNHITAALADIKVCTVIAKDRAKARDKDGAHVFFERAKRIAAAFRDGHEVHAYRQIADAQREAQSMGKTSDALKTLDEAKEMALQGRGSWMDYLLIGQAQVKAGDKAAARQTLAKAKEMAIAKLDENDWTRVFEYVQIAEAQASAEDVDGTRETVKLIVPITKDIDKKRLCWTIVDAQVKAGDLAGAKETAALFAGDDEQALKAYTDIVADRARQISKPEVAQALEQTQAAVARLNGRNARAHSEIAVTQAKMGHKDEARKTFDLARTAASQTKEAYYRAYAYKEIAEAQLEAGDVAEAKKTLITAREAAAMVGDNDHKISNAPARASIPIAYTQAKAGDIAGARETAVLIKEQEYSNKEYRAHLYLLIAREQAMRGDLVGAMESVADAGEVGEQRLIGVFIHEALMPQ